MSNDLYLWLSGAAKHPRRLADRLADGKAGALGPDPRVLAFRAERLRRRPDLADRSTRWPARLPC